MKKRGFPIFDVASRGLARLVLDLWDLIQIARPARCYVTLPEFASVHFRGESWEEASTPRAVYRIAAKLAEHGLELEVVTTEENGMEIRVDTPQLADLVEPLVRSARVHEERRAARRERRRPELEGLDEERELITAATVAVDYRDRIKSFAWVTRKHGIGKGRLRRLLVSTGPLRAPRVRRTVEELRARRDVKRALDLYDREARVEGLSGLALVASVLTCSLDTAARFLRRAGRTIRRPGRPAEGSD